jgi:hypothetical protein
VNTRKQRPCPEPGEATGTRRSGDQGTVIGGPIQCGAFSYYFVRWTDDEQSWVAQNWVIKQGTPTEGAPVDVGIAKAVVLNWPTEEGKRYQIYSSPNLNTWHALLEPFVGNGRTMTFAVESLNLSQYFKLTELLGQSTTWIPGVTQVRTEGVRFTPTAGGFFMRNARFLGPLFELGDLVDAQFVFDPSLQHFIPAEYEIVKDIGVFNSPYFAKTVTPQFALRSDSGFTYSAGVFHALSSTSEGYYFHAEPGHVVSFNIRNISDDFVLLVTGPTGEVIGKEFWNKGTSGISWGYPLLRAGKHAVKFVPIGASSAFFSCRFFNANRRQLVEVVNGTRISVSLESNIRDYAKFQMHLNKDDVLRMPAPITDIRFTLVDEASRQVTTSSGLPLLYVAEHTGAYFLFIDNRNAWGGSFAGNVSISSSGQLPTLNGVDVLADFDDSDRELLRGVTLPTQSLEAH